MRAQKGTLPVGNGLQPHPFSEIVPGEMSAEEFLALCDSIKVSGLRHPIVMFEGKILDGRARYKACVETKTEPRAIEFTGKDPENYVLNVNLHRRQLNSIQKAMVAAAMCLRKENPLTQKDAAQMVGVGILTLNLAVKLLASKNTLLIKRCENGETTRAELAELLYEDEPPAPRKSSNVIKLDPLPKGSGQVGTKRPQQRAVETTASKLVAGFKSLSVAEQKSFVEMVWTWLAPTLVQCGKLPRQLVSVKPAKAVKPAKRKAA